MPNTVVFLWISAATSPLPLPSPSAPPPPPAAASAALADFGSARGINFRPSAQGLPVRPQGLPASDASGVDVIEAELEQARVALSALEEDAASARLAQVESQLLAHPHLPQAAFLMGECLALQARAAWQQDPARARALEARRSAIEGVRASAFGETVELPAPPTRSIAVDGLAERDELELDGAVLGTARQVELAPGLHQVRVFRGGRLVFASFAELSDAQQALQLAVPPLAACSLEDLTDPHGVACARWAKARPEPGGVGVAFCERERCGAFLHWRRRVSAPFQPLNVERAGLPAWAGFAIAGAVAAVGTSLVLWQSGAFERTRPDAASWQYGGLSP